MMQNTKDEVDEVEALARRFKNLSELQMSVLADSIEQKFVSGRSYRVKMLEPAGALVDALRARINGRNMVSDIEDDEMVGGQLGEEAYNLRERLATLPPDACKELTNQLKP